jgi:hypothetical protein
MLRPSLSSPEAIKTFPLEGKKAIFWFSADPRKGIGMDFRPTVAPNTSIDSDRSSVTFCWLR